MLTPTVVVALLLAAGLALMCRTGVHVRRRRVGAASRNGLGAGCCLALGGLGLALVMNFYTYQRLTYEQPIAHLKVHQLGSQRYRVEVTTADGRSHQFDLVGDAWQMDARVLKWRGWANLVGLDSVYRLDRLSARYQRIEAARREPHSVYRLQPESGRGLSVWSAVHFAERFVPLIDTRYGSAVYMPLSDGAVYGVSLTQSGLVARPKNAAADSAVKRWAG